VARRATGLKATAANGPTAQPPASAKRATPAKRAVSAKPAARATPAKPGAQPAAPGAQTAAPGAQPAAARPRLIALRLAAAALALEAVGLAVAAVFAAIATVDGRAYQLAGGIAATLIALATGSGVAGLAVALASARPWTRIPTAILQLFVILAGVTLLQGNRPEWGAPALALAAACLAGLMTPASLRALNRPPVQHQPEGDKDA
jgi:hypothetical protein